MNTEKINGYVVITVDETFAVAHYGSQVVQTGTPDEVRAYCTPEARAETVETPAEPVTQSGYTSCACRDCMDVAISGDVSKPEPCLLCKDAGCEISYGAHMGSTGEHSTECQRDDAYGDDTDA